MRVSHTPTAVFDDPNLVSVGGLVPVVALAERCGLPELVSGRVAMPGASGTNAAAKVGAPSYWQLMSASCSTPSRPTAYGRVGVHIALYEPAADTAVSSPALGSTRYRSAISLGVSSANSSETSSSTTR